jgi:hypothetical protein
VLRKRAWLALRAKIDEQTADQAFLSKLRNHFEERFRYDEGGVPRVWKPDDDIDSAFKQAKDQVCISASTRSSVSNLCVVLDPRACAFVLEDITRGRVFGV